MDHHSMRESIDSMIISTVCTYTYICTSILTEYIHTYTNTTSLSHCTFLLGYPINRKVCNRQQRGS
ncbi:hypothetical protein BDV32DRAFT_129959 [Aspergillus pseudonomiae]|nr:hypothetical protein BDV32DRAFT_129959 [Aspergillus pseudonomiae]